jgi:SAM-dependent methyltransferase
MAARLWQELKRARRTLRHAVLPHDKIYTRDYYAADVEEGAVRSAAVMARSIFAWAKPQTVIDVGCGTGSLLEAFGKLGCDGRGLEYSQAGLDYCRRRGLAVQKFNIEKDSLADDARCDLAVSFEVAEHLPARSAGRYAALLCGLSPRVVMSAATPGQGGRGHLNEQPHAYWIEKLAGHGLRFDAATSRRFADEWKAAGASHWYCDNVMAFARGGAS